MTRRKLYLGPLTDNRRWEHIRLRHSDVIVVTPPKCGTTWMQTILALLLSGDPDTAPDVSENMPWIDIRFRDISALSDRLGAMTRRRSMKSHTPMDGLPLNDDALYLCLFRHPLDTHLSFCNHARNIPMSWFDHLYPEDDADGLAFRWFLEGGPEGFDGDAGTLAHILRHYEAARAVADRPNVAMFHYADMMRDLKGCFARVSGLLGVSHSARVMEQLVAAARFEHMKSQAERYAPAGGKGFFRSDSAFFHRGGCGNWRGKLSTAQLAAYDAMLDDQLTADARAWLEHGETGLPVTV